MESPYFLERRKRMLEKTLEKKEIKRIRPVSDKRKVVNRIYKKIVKEY